ncbi:MAG: GGDEF domain-containing protein [Candidatus Zixiibacteriota bacterium]
MPNIADITLANWQVFAESDRPPQQRTTHFAIRQTRVNLDFYLGTFFRNRKLKFHFFRTFDELVTVCHRHQVSAILIAGDGDFIHELELVRAIKKNILLSIVPVILYHPDPDTNTVVAAYESGVEEFIYGEWIKKLVQVRIERVIERSHRDISVNPSTLLPGPAMIEEEINRQMKLGEQFAVCYADLDNFKAFNDYHGYVYGDKVIRMTGRILRDVVFDLCREGFVGHIAGDDFICVMPSEVAEEACRWIIKCFDAFIPYCYNEDDRARGYYEARNRRGQMERFTLLSISIAVVVNHNGEFEHIGELSKMLADLKRACKAREGSNYMIERRKKY